MNQEPSVAIITGGAQGIGKAATFELAKQGSVVVIADINVPLACQTAMELTKRGFKAVSMKVDVSQRESVFGMVAAVVDEFSRIDILVNNAAIAGRAAPLVEQTEAEWDQLIATDLKSVFLCCQAILPQMLRQRSGAIVNVASIAGKEGNPNMVPYSTAKAGVIGFTKALAKEVALLGIRVNAISPAVIDTPLLSQLTPAQNDLNISKIPLGRVGQPEEAAHVIAFLASQKASFVTGQCYDVSGGRATY